MTVEEEIIERIVLLELVAAAAAELYEKCRTTAESGFCDFNKKMLMTEVGVALEGPLLALQKFNEGAPDDNTRF
jgi:hypothetical protein